MLRSRTDGQLGKAIPSAITMIAALLLGAPAAGQVQSTNGREHAVRAEAHASAKSRHERKENPGALLWEDHLDQSQGFEFPLAVDAKDGTVAVIGMIAEGNDPADGLLRVYDGATGSLRWQDRFDILGGDEEAHAVVVTPDLVVVGGYAIDVEGEFAGFVRAYARRSGRLQWADVFDVAGTFDSVEALSVHGKQLFATGATDDDLVTRAYRLDTGRLLWEARHDSAGGFGLGSGVAATGNLVLVSGFSAWVPGEFNFAYFVAAYHARTGTLAWEDEIKVPGVADTATGIVARGGRVYTAGSSNDDWMVRTYGARSGRVRWEDTFALAGPSAGPDIAFHVAADEKYVVAAGYGASSQSAQSRDWVARGYDAKTGTLLWTDHFDFDADRDQAIGGVAVGHDMAFVYGIRAGETWDTVLRAYRAGSGEVLWEDVIDKSGLDDTLSSYPGLALDGKRVTIVGGSRIQRSDGTSDLDWIVRTYDASKR